MFTAPCSSLMYCPSVDMRCSLAMLLVLLSTTALSACVEDDSADTNDRADAGVPDGTAHADGADHTPDGDETGGRAITLTFSAAVGTQPLDCTSTYSDAIAGFNFALNDLRFFVSEISLIDAVGELYPLTLDEGTEWQSDGIALLDFEDGTGSCSNATAGTRTTITGSVAPGDYTGVAFTLGVPQTLNHVNPVEQTGPLANVALHWSWMMGYKHFQLEGSLDESGLVLLHLGSKGCMGIPPTDFACSISNRPRVELTGADPTSTAIVLDLAELLADSTPVDNEVFCMAEQSSACAGLLGALGLDMASGTPISGATTRVFRFAE
jgi:uncharacterized repeat protein (TIGR04052 family)